MSLGHWPTRWAENTPDKEVIKYNDSTFTWAEFNNRINQAAHALQQAGVKKGDRIAALMANSNVFLEILFATAKLGVILTPLNFRLASPELAFIVNDAEPGWMFYSPEFKEVVGALKSSCPTLKSLVCETAGGLEGDTEYETWLQGRPNSEPVPDSEVVMEDTAIIMYTSGTTGRPKGAMILHQNMVWNGINSLMFNTFRGQEISLCNAPLFHIGALNVSATPLLYAGCKLVIQRFFDPSQALRLIEAEKITIMFGVPVMFQFMMLVPEWEAADLSSVEQFVAGGAPCPRDLIEAYQAKGTHFLQGYGMTESAAGATLLAPEYALDKLGSAGRPLFHQQLKIAGLSGETLNRKEIGEIVIKGPNVIREYWRMPEETANCIVDGWLHTGDMGYLDEDGFLYVTDRKKDMYISGGENVYPTEVEHILTGFPQISEVAVIGIPDEKWGEIGLAIVVPAQGVEFSEDDFYAFCKENLAGYKRPRKVVLSDQPLARTATGKLIKKDYRRIYAQG